jgi:ABC-2 type transport system permease protein
MRWSRSSVSRADGVATLIGHINTSYYAMGALAIYLRQVGAAIRVSFADRANFWLQLGGMTVNNGFILLLWFMFFAGFRSLGGWRLADVALMIGILALSVGLAGVFAGGYRDMAAVILRDEVDTLLTQPRAVLPRLLARESIASAWGDVIVGVILLASFAALRWSDLPVLLFVLCGSLTVFLATGVLFASLAFWVRGARSFARDVVDFVILLSSYPGSIYSGAMKVVIYTFVPAGFVVLVPVAVLREHSLAGLMTMAGAAVGYAGLAIAVFLAGLRRYRG